jgi:hypothetical protein
MILRSIAAAALALASASAAIGPQIVFTTRGQLDSPIVISSFAESKVYGFDAVMLRNDGSAPVTAVQFVVTFRTDSGDEVAEERRFAVELLSHETKRVTVDLGHIEGLRQKIKSALDSKALAVLSLKLVEFRNGESWRPGGPIEGTPVQGVDVPFQPLRKK